MQLEMLIEDVNQAFSDAVRMCGGAKEVGMKLRPELDPADAGNWVLNCCNPKHSQKFSLDQIQYLILMFNEHGCHLGINTLCRDGNYGEPTPITPAERQTELAKIISNAATTMQAAMKQLNEIKRHEADSSNGLQAVKRS